MGKGSDRLYGMYDHCDPDMVALRKEVPKPNFDYQGSFLNEVVRLLRSRGRDVYISRATTAMGIEAYVKVPAIQERQPGIIGKLKDVAFSILDIFYGAPNDLRKLGAVLYRLGDDFSEIEDPEVRNALEEADKRYPYQHDSKLTIQRVLRFQEF